MFELVRLRNFRIHRHGTHTDSRHRTTTIVWYSCAFKSDHRVIIRIKLFCLIKTTNRLLLVVKYSPGISNINKVCFFSFNCRFVKRFDWKYKRIFWKIKLTSFPHKVTRIWAFDWSTKVNLRIEASRFWLLIIIVETGSQSFTTPITSEKKLLQN